MSKKHLLEESAIKMQQEMQELNTEMGHVFIEGESHDGHVFIKIDGNHHVHDITVKADGMNQNQILQAVTEAFNDAVFKANADLDQRVSTIVHKYSEEAAGKKH